MDRYNEQARYRTEDDLKAFVDSQYMDGFTDFTGDVQGPGHFTRWEPMEDSYVIIETDPAIRIVGCILHTDNDGFKYLHTFSSAVDFEKDWENTEEMVATFYDDEDLDEDDQSDPGFLPRGTGGLLDELAYSEGLGAEPDHVHEC